MPEANDKEDSDDSALAIIDWLQYKYIIFNAGVTLHQLRFSDQGASTTFRFPVVWKPKQARGQPGHFNPISYLRLQPPYQFVSIPHFFKKRNISGIIPTPESHKQEVGWTQLFFIAKFVSVYAGLARSTK